MSESCKNCRFWEILWIQKTCYGDVEYGDCKRRSPYLATNYDSPIGRWPSTKANDWCGEYEQRDAQVMLEQLS